MSTVGFLYCRLACQALVLLRRATGTLTMEFVQAEDIRARSFEQRLLD